MEATFEGYKNYLLDDGETDSDAREIAAGDLIPTLEDIIHLMYRMTS